MKLQDQTFLSRKCIGVVVLLAALCLVTLVASQLQASASGDLASPPAAEGVASTPTPIPCPTDPPPTGDRVKLRSEDEIVVAARHWHDDYYLRNYVMDSSDSGLSLPTSVTYTDINALTHVHDLSVTAADLNGDGRVERIRLLRTRATVSAPSAALPAPPARRGIAMAIATKGTM